MLPHLAARIFGTPLLVQRAKLDVILAALGPRLGALDLPEVEVAPPAPRPAVPDAAGIAVIPIHGTLVKRTLGLEPSSGLASYAGVGAMLEAALADPRVGGILLDVDSPGGEASGSFDLARHVREVSRVKPVWAVANDAAFSAAYAIACAAERLVVTETGGVGSIGVIALHVDQSERDATEGYHYTAITAGAHKNDFSPHEPLTDTARETLQGEVDRLYALFVGHVAAMREVPAAEVRATDAALYFGPLAVAAGLADAVGTLETTLAELSAHLQIRARQAPAARGLPRRGAPHPSEPTMENGSPALPGADATAELLAQARREAGQTAQAIAELCLIAGCPERAAEHIAAGRSESEVRRALCAARAARSEQTPIHSTLASEAGTEDGVRPETSPIVTAVKKLVHQE